MNTKFSLVFIILVSSLITGCAQIRKVTYPSNFVYLDHSLVQTTMLRISLAMRSVDETLMGGEPISDADQQLIKQRLSAIDELSDKLATGSLVTNHLVIDDHIDDFKREVRNAIRTANASPPNFYAAGHRGLGDKQFLRRTPETAELRNLKKSPELSIEIRHKYYLSL